MTIHPLPFWYTERDAKSGRNPHYFLGNVMKSNGKPESRVSSSNKSTQTPPNDAKTVSTSHTTNGYIHGQAHHVHEFNLLAWIKKNDPRCHVKTKLFVECILDNSHSALDPYWRNITESYLRSLMLYVAFDPDFEQPRTIRSLMGLITYGCVPNSSSTLSPRKSLLLALSKSSVLSDSARHDIGLSLIHI